MAFAYSCLTGFLFMVCNVYAAGTGTELDPFQQYVKQGHEAVLQCSFQSTRLRWYKNMNAEWIIIANQYVTINDTKYKVPVNPNTGLYYLLHVLNTQSADEGIYRCRGGIAEEYFLQLIFYEEPSSLTIQNASTNNRLIGTEGHDLLIECKAVGGNPAPSLSLVVLGTKVQTSVQKVRYSVQKIARIYDQTNISCEANSDAFDTTMTTTTIIYLKLMPLVPILNASFVNTLEMVPFSLSCVSTGSRPAATFWWTVGQTDATFEASSQENRDSDESYTVTSTLTYVVDRKYNLQPIICKANNTVGGFSNNISLFVRFAPDVSVSNVTYEMKDSTRTINCTAEGYPDTYTFYKWQHKSVYGRFIRELDGENILTLPVVPAKIRYQDNGEYVCTVSNGIQGTDGAEKRKGAAHIIAYAQPVITFDNEGRRIQYGEIGKSVEIVVHVYSVPKFYYHTWFNNGKQIQFSTKFLISESSAEVEDVFHGKTVQVDGYVLKLTINDIKNEDYSNYTLILGNGMGEPIEHTVVLELSLQRTIETSSSGVIIGAVTGSLISLLILILVLIFVIVRKRRGDQQSDDTVKFENIGSDDQTNVYEEVRNNKESKEKRDESWTKQYEALGLTDTPNTYDDLSNKGPEGKNNQSSTSNYEVLGSKEAPNVYDDLNNKASQETRAQSSTPHYDELGAKDVPNVYDELNNEASQENGDQSYRSNYEALGRKDRPNVYDDLGNGVCEENKAQSSNKYYEDLGLRNKPSVYDDIRNEGTQDKVYENDSFQRDKSVQH